MINETARLFINYAKAADSAPKQDKLIGEVPIKEYINFDSPEWSEFSYTESSKDDATKIMNKYLVIITEGRSVDKVVKMFINQLTLRATEEVTKKMLQTETLESGCGDLIFQSRTMVQLFEQPDGMIRLRWRGKLDRIPSEPKRKKKRVPMYDYGKSSLIKASDIQLEPQGTSLFAKWAEIFEKETNNPDLDKEFNAAFDALNLKTIPQSGGRIFKPGDDGHVKITGQEIRVGTVIGACDGVMIDSEGRLVKCQLKNS